MSSRARSVVGITSAAPTLALFAALMQLDRAGRMTERDRLRKTIRDLHGVESSHLRSARVQEVFEGQTVWEGVVEVFALKGHPKAALAYASSCETDDGGRRYVAVLRVHPIKTAQDPPRTPTAAQHPPPPPPTPG